MTLFGSMNTAVQALNAFSVSIGNISDNVANTSTTGYKTVETQFSDLVATKLAGASPVLDSTVQGGVNARADFANRSQGQIVTDSTGSSAAISGAGFFPVAKATGIDPATGEPTGFDGTAYYTRQGDFHLDNSGHLVNSAGYYLMTAAADGTGKPQVLTIDTADRATAGLTDVSISDGGMVMANYGDHTSIAVGQILLANVQEPNRMGRVDGVAFLATAKSGDAVYGNPADKANDAGVGSVVGSSLELSTTDTTGQMTQLIQTQQAYSMNSQIITISNEMLQTAVNLKT